jgi:hypothetical protein
MTLSAPLSPKVARRSLRSWASCLKNFTKITFRADISLVV